MTTLGSSISVVNLTKTYRTVLGSRTVLENCHLSIPKHVSIGLVGRNGAGKSTLLRILAGAESPTSGSLEVPRSTSWAIGLTAGQALALTGRQNTRFIARLHGAAGAELRHIEAYAQWFSELGDAFDEPTGTYSTGMRSRLAFAQATAIDFDLVLLDELTAVGDESFRNKCREALNVRKAHSQFIVASHSRVELEAIADWGVFIVNKKLYTYPTVGAAFDAYRDFMQQGKAPDESLSLPKL